MNTIQQEFKDQAIFRFQEKKTHITKCFQQLTEKDMWSRPNASSNSVGNIILHLCGNIGQYILSSLAQQPDVRERDLEFSTEGGLSKAELLHKLSTTIDEACAAVNACADAELLQKRQVQGFTFSGVGIILHAVEHLSYHTGQIAYLVKLRNDQQIGLYDDFNLNTKNAD
jgi:uncharacterized damage-inducible protein DinB